jgi:hypothetical protein
MRNRIRRKNGADSMHRINRKAATAATIKALTTRLIPAQAAMRVVRLQCPGAETVKRPQQRGP